MKFVCGNFKMNGSVAGISGYVNSLNELDQDILENICVCLPHPLLGFAQNAKFNIGAQDCSNEKHGAFTGDTSPILLHECGAKYVLIGHSERRKYHKETDAMIYKKAVAAAQCHLTPIVCIGETKDQINDRYEILRTQMSALNTKFNDKPIKHIMIAYEPVCAIGTGEVPESKTIDSVCEFISELAIKIFGRKICVLYGGSVNADNAEEILSLRNVDGVLVGGACLEIEKFKPIINQASRY
jgi:triosephosphate isomerase